MPGFPCSSRAGHSLFARIQGEPALLRGVCCLQGAGLQARQGGHPRVPEGPPCTLGDANQHRITWKVGQRGRPRAPCTRRRTAVSHTRASRRVTATDSGWRAAGKQRAVRGDRTAQLAAQIFNHWKGLRCSGSGSSHCLAM